MCEQALSWTCPLCGAVNYGDTGPQPCWQCQDNSEKAAKIIAQQQTTNKARVAESPTPTADVGWTAETPEKYGE